MTSALFWPAFAVDTLWRAFAASSGEFSAAREAADVFVYILALAGIWAIVIPAAVAARQRRFVFSAKALALLPVYCVLVSAAAWTAIVDLILRPHYWAKTAHGRSPRAAVAPGLRGVSAPTVQPSKPPREHSPPSDALSTPPALRDDRGLTVPIARRFRRW